MPQYLENNKNMSKKSQINVIDLFVAVFIFCILITITMVTWNNYGKKIIEKTEYYDMVTEVFQLSNAFVKTPGYPADWTNESVKIIGLASKDRILSEEKVDKLVALNLNKTKETLNSYGYNFYFTLQTPSKNITYGLPVTGKKSIGITRYVLLENERAEMRVYLWK